MTPYEIAHVLCEPFLPTIYGKVRKDLRLILRQVSPGTASVLDIGGRQSSYTIALPAEITILDLPRDSEIQKLLRLGLTDDIIRSLQKRRSNIKRVILEDMTRCTLPSESFDGAVAIEVIEHVADDHAFLRQVARVLKPGGFVYMTTPNGDYIRNEPPNYNPDHLRHYTRAALRDLLQQYFMQVDVTYGVKTGKHHLHGLKSFSLRNPFTLLKTMAHNMINHLESRGLDGQCKRTAHLFAIARKAERRGPTPAPLDPR